MRLHKFALFKLTDNLNLRKVSLFSRSQLFDRACVCVCVLSWPITTRNSQAFFFCFFSACRKMSVYYNSQSKTVENSSRESLSDLPVCKPCMGCLVWVAVQHQGLGLKWCWWQLVLRKTDDLGSRWRSCRESCNFFVSHHWAGSEFSHTKTFRFSAQTPLTCGLKGQC